MTGEVEHGDRQDAVDGVGEGVVVDEGRAVGGVEGYGAARERLLEGVGGSDCAFEGHLVRRAVGALISIEEDFVLGCIATDARLVVRGG